MRALLNLTVPLIEFKACFPNGTWYGIGLGTQTMKDAELLFFMGGTDIKHQKVLSLKG